MFGDTDDRDDVFVALNAIRRAALTASLIEDPPDPVLDGELPSDDEFYDSPPIEFSKR